ncbi:MAG: Flp pilus assembly protein ATPase CpaE [Frankiales bacterium]|nr:Flp pilus assembly protein ATPase CpaE [Frankiales bacterium]
MTVSALVSAAGASWEGRLLSGLTPSDQLLIRKRCVDVVELLAAAEVGLGEVAFISVAVVDLDADVVARLRVCGVVAVGVVEVDDRNERAHFASLGIEYVVPAHAQAAVFASVAGVAVRGGTADTGSAGYDFSEPWATTRGRVAGAVTADPAFPDESHVELRAPELGLDSAAGAVIAVWGPTGAPGRTTVAVGLAHELVCRCQGVLLVDADVYGGAVSSLLGLLDESPGLAAACRHAHNHQLDVAVLASLAWQLEPGLRVLTGIARADRWPEIRPAALGETLRLARGLAPITVVDVGFCLETDEELSFDTVAPRRNGATLAALTEADLIIAVGSADPVGMQRLVRGLGELGDTDIETPVWVVLNRVQPAAAGRSSTAELKAALLRFAERTPAAFLPYDRSSLDAAASAGRSLMASAPSSPLRGALADLAGSILGMPAERGRRRVKR